MSNYGIPYMGSKSGIVASIALNFPKADHFYDLFGGGFSVSHYMLQNKSKNYKTFHYNEIKPHIADTVKKAIGGDFSYERFKPPWISIKDFHEKKNIDGYVSSCWSFGNNGDNYLFSKEIEEYKRAMHMAVVFNEFDELAYEVFGFREWPAIAKTIKQKRFYLGQLIEHYRTTKIPNGLIKFINSKQLQQLEQLERLQQLRQLEQLEQLQRLQRLQQLERLQQLRQLEQLVITSKDYRDVFIEKNSVVYCDIPYQGTGDYGNSFDHKSFFDWAAKKDCPVFVSEYEIKDPRFKLVYEVDKRIMLTQSGDSNKVGRERLYWNGVS